jgi:hypothetical protein
MPGLPDNRDISLKQQHDISLSSTISFCLYFGILLVNFRYTGSKFIPKACYLNDLQGIDKWHEIKYTSDGQAAIELN